MSERRVPMALDTPFLAAKVQLPTGVVVGVHRPRLVEALSAGEAGELTVVSGPAGAGKTTALVDWLTSIDERLVAWLALDEFDDDPTQFWTGVVAALASMPDSPLADRAGQLAGLARADTRTFLAALDAALDPALFGGGRRPVLVLDDYHEIEDAEIHDGLRLAIRYFSSRLRIIVATRTTPPLGLGRLRARGQLCEIRFDDLRFTDGEGSQLLDVLGGTETEEGVRAQLMSATDGWAAALYVSALSMVRQPSRPESPESPAGVDSSQRHLSEYLVEEVLATVPDDRRRFLLETSVLDRLTPDRCDALTGRNDSAAVLFDLEATSQFVRRLDRDGTWFTAHGLLRDLLRAELPMRGLDPGALHRRASMAAAREGDGPTAVHHALETGDVALAADAIVDQWIDLTNRGRFATVMSWIDRWSTLQAGDPAAGFDPAVLIVGGWTALHTGRLDEVEFWLGRAEADPANDAGGPLADGTASLASAVSIVRTSHRRRVGLVEEGVASSEVAAWAEADPRSPWRAVAQVGRGATLFWSGRWEEATECLTDAVAVASATGLAVPVVLGQGYLALIDRRDGQGDRARQRAEDAVAAANQHRLLGYDQAAPAHLAMALCHLDAVEIEPARPLIEVALRLGIQGNERLVAAAAHLARAELAHLTGDGPSADADLAAAIDLRDRCQEPGLLSELIAETERRLSIGPSARRPDSLDDLTPRELTVLRYLRSDLSLPAIARELHVSPNTIKSQVSSIRSKLGASSRSEAVEIARDRGLLS